MKMQVTISFITCALLVLGALYIKASAEENYILQLEKADLGEI